MLTLNGNKLALNDKEFISSLFLPGATCVGYYKVHKNSIAIMDHQKTKVGVISNNVLAKATKQENGRYWYSYGNIDIIGDYKDNYSLMYEDIKEAMDLIPIKIIK